MGADLTPAPMFRQALVSVSPASSACSSRSASLPAAADRPQKPKPISAKIRATIDAMGRGDVKTTAAAAESAGLSREHLSRELAQAAHRQALARKGRAESGIEQRSRRCHKNRYPGECQRYGERPSEFVASRVGRSFS